MKRAISVFGVLILIFVLSFSVGAQDVFIVDEGDDNFVPPTTAPTTEAATTKSLAPIIDGEALEGYIGQISGALSGGIDSLLEKFGPNFEGFNQGGSNNQGSSGGSVNLPQINITGGSANKKETTTAQESTTLPSAAAAQGGNNSQNKEELPSVLIVNQGEDSNSYLSGSTLTLIIFIAAIVLLVLAIVFALIVMTRKTEFNSAVKNKSTLPSVDRPDTRSQFLTDDDLFDSEDYSNINYWEND